MRTKPDLAVPTSVAILRRRDNAVIQLIPFVTHTFQELGLKADDLDVALVASRLEGEAIRLISRVARSNKGARARSKTARSK